MRIKNIKIQNMYKKEFGSFVFLEYISKINFVSFAWE